MEATILRRFGSFVFVVLAISCTCSAVIGLNDYDGGGGAHRSQESGNKCGKDCTYTIESGGVLVISGTGDMEDYSDDNKPWSCEGIGKVVINSGITSIGESSFYDCKSVKSVEIPSSVTRIGERAFYGTGLKSVIVPPSVSTIMQSAFARCYSLSNATISTGVTSIGRFCFEECYSLKSVTIPSTVSTIGGGVFEQCYNLTSIDVDAGNTHYKSVNGVLFDYEVTTLVQYPEGQGSSYKIPEGVRMIGPHSFCGCTLLTDVIIPDSVISINKSAFNECSNLQSVVIPSSVASIEEDAFGDCVSLTSVTIPDSVKHIDDKAFSGCTNLSSIFFQGSQFIESEAFKKLGNAKTICVPPDYSYQSFCGRNVTVSKDCDVFKELFDQCFKGAFINNSFVQQKWENVTEWEKQSNNCLEYSCNSLDGLTVQSTCTASDTLSRTCVNDQCVTDRSSLNDTYVEMELDGAKVSDLNMTELKEIISFTFSDSITIGWESDDDGNIIRLIVYVNDKETANAISSAMNECGNKER